MIAQAYLARVRELLADTHSRDVPSASAGRDFHRAHRLSGHADAADRSGAEELDGARRKRRARRPQEAGHGDEPRRQQRGHEPCRAGSARATWASRRHHGLVPLRRAGGIVLRARIAPRHSWRRRRDIDHAGALPPSTCATRRSPIFRSASIAMEKDYRWLSTHRPAPFAWQTQDLHASGAAGDADAGLRGKRRAPARSRRARILRTARRCRQIRSGNAFVRPEDLRPARLTICNRCQNMTARNSQAAIRRRHD